MRRILENISANLMIRLIAYLFSFLTVAYAARILQPEAFGRFSFVSSFTGYAVMLANLGMPIYGMRLCAEKKGEQLRQTVSELWFINTSLSIISAVLLTILVVTIPRLWQEKTLFLIYGSGILLQAFGFEWLFRGLEKFKFLAVCQLIAKAISLLLMFVFVRSSDQLLLYAGLSVITAYGSNLICFCSARKYVDVSLVRKWPRILSHLQPLFIFFLMSCAVSIYSSLDLTMLGFMKSDLETGLYSVAAKGKGVLTLIGGIVWSSILPQATRLWKDGKKDKFESLAGKSLVIVSGIQFFITVFCWAFSKHIVFLLGGEAYLESVRSFRLLLLSLIPIGISNILGGQVLIPAGKERLLLRAEIVGAVINFVANLFVIPIWSIEGAAVTTVISEVVVTALCLFYCHRDLQMDFGVGLTLKIWRWGRIKLRKIGAVVLSQICRDRLPYYCPCCETRLKGFVENEYRLHPETYDVKRYEGIDQKVICPVCGSLPRHRILSLWCADHIEELKRAEILYFSPEVGMMRWMKKNGISCTTADLEEGADLKLDIQKIGLPDASYDFIFCNHVLEHVEDYKSALAEIRRVLRENGQLICSFPMDPKVDLVDEDPMVTTEEDMIRRFGQNNHRRVFGMRAGELLKDAGFEVETIRGEECPNEVMPIVGPGNYDMNILFVCTKRLTQCDKEKMNELDTAAETLATQIKTIPLTDPLMKHLEARSAEFLRSRGFDISTRAGCKAALDWLKTARVEDAFWLDLPPLCEHERTDSVDVGDTVGKEGGVATAADWYIGEARLDGMRRIVEHRLETFFPKQPLPDENSCFGRR